MSDVPAVDNFGKALLKLREFTTTPIVDDRDRAGIVQALEFTFEQCWKAFQQIAMAQGIAAASPRQSLEAAVRLSLIRREDEKAWLDMLHDRNMTSHLYQEAMAVEIAQRVVDRYLALLEKAHRACA
jgi:nucleotidyltransferase substrate binding protein (TIGR01987 family)